MTNEQPTAGGVPITDETIDQLVAEAEHGYDVDTLRRRGGRQRASLSADCRTAWKLVRNGHRGPDGLGGAGGRPVRRIAAPPVS
jgi:hypothetical protein